jgi:hypothetical protein
MAAWFDLKDRVEALEEAGIAVDSAYRGEGLPKWLTPALGGCDVYVLNAKGVAVDDALCVVRLSKLEELMASFEK